MRFLTVIFLVVGLVVIVTLSLFVLSALREKNRRALLVSGALWFVFTALWVAWFVITPADSYLLLLPVWIVILLVVLFFIPLGRITAIEISGGGERVDERDIMFSREEYLPGSKKYQTYYQMHPEKKEIDDRMRRLPEFLEPGGKFYDSVISARADKLSDELEEMMTAVDGTVSPTTRDVDPVEMTAAIKQYAIQLGADLIGVCELNQAYVYTHVGRGSEPWGQPINNHHKYAIAIGLEMDYSKVEEAPRVGITEESMTQYLRGARISIQLAEHIRSLGYPTRAHIAGSNYQIMLPPVAYDAGLGELGRHGYLISPKFGSRIRLGAITTDLPLIADRPITFGVQQFCGQCKKCATNCPSASIPSDDKTIVHGVEKWQLQVESCYYYWRVIGTDCGLCMKVCPYSHPNSLMHRLIRTGIRRSAFARWISVHGDDIVYGRKSFIK